MLVADIAVAQQAAAQPSVAQQAATQPAPKSKSGVWRLEIGNEDKGGLEAPFEAVFDPIFGENAPEGELTWAWRLSYDAPEGDKADWVRGARRYLFWVPRRSDVRYGYSAEQAAHTANSIIRAANGTVRPHAGYLAFGTRLSFTEKETKHLRRMDTIDAAIGFVGPFSLAQTFHEAAHDIKGSDTDPWDEINSEPFANINIEHGHRLFLRPPDAGGHNLELHPYIGGAFGNAFTYASAGVTLRIGNHLDKDAGAPRFRQILSGSNFPQIGNYFAWNVFVGIEGRAIAHNVLFGNTFEEGRSEEFRAFVYDVQAGLELGWGAYRLSAMNVFRLREFEGQGPSAQFVRVALSAHF